MKYTCDMIKDLLPLYADEVCSDESRKAVAEHINSCPNCKDMLQKMNRQVAVNVNNDIGTLKRIKRRLCIEKAVIALVSAIVLIGAGWTACFMMLNTDQTMDYEKYDLAENVYAEEDADGNVWLVKRGPAIEAWLIYPNVRDENGNYMSIDDGFDRNRANGYTVTLKERKINDLFTITVDRDSKLCQERTMIIEADSDFDQLYYYDDRTDTEYLLWERGE